ncbi:MAG: hypothetical protein ICV67_02075 [Thermoleophilia bacterium]|nr:hypothetical protein [Thermoleophilia bacterium]
MPTKTEAIREELVQLKGDLKSLAVVVREDPSERARKERAWKLLYGGIAAGLTLASRRLAARVWWVLTGRTPPTRR